MTVRKQLILASGSPRRRNIMRDAGYTFDTDSADVDEVYPDDLDAEHVPEFLAELKADYFSNDLNDKVFVTADTVVILAGNVIGKPTDAVDSRRMLQSLSGQRHRVVSGVCVLSADKRITFSDKTDVYFRTLTDNEIDRYIAECQPFDKAGSYGIQEQIGMIGITHIEGSYFNVMGLPIHKLYATLCKEFGIRP